MTRRPDQTTVGGHDRDGNKIGPLELTGREARLVARLALIMVMLPDAIQREKREQSTRRGSDQPDPIRLEVVDYRQSLLHPHGELAEAVRVGWRLLGLSNQIERLRDYRCPECDCRSLILDRDEWTLFCPPCDLHWAVEGSQIAAIIEQQNQPEPGQTPDQEAS